MRRVRSSVAPSLPAITLVMTAMVAACDRRAASAESEESPAAGLPVDHVILAIDSLERGVDLLHRATGLTPVYGGAHPGRGTQNALLSLDSGRYLELLAPNYADTTASARATERERTAYYATFRTLTPAGWAIHAPDAAAERARLLARGFAPGNVQPGSRERPDGRTLRWHTLDPWGGPQRLVLPFIIAWTADSPHPSVDAPTGCRLTELAIASPSADSLGRLFQAAEWSVPIRADSTERLEFTLDCPAGVVRFP